MYSVANLFAFLSLLISLSNIGLACPYGHLDSDTVESILSQGSRLVPELRNEGWLSFGDLQRDSWVIHPTIGKIYLHEIDADNGRITYRRVGASSNQRLIASRDHREIVFARADSPAAEHYSRYRASNHFNPNIVPLWFGIAGLLSRVGIGRQMNANAIAWAERYRQFAIEIDPRFRTMDAQTFGDTVRNWFTGIRFGDQQDMERATRLLQLIYQHTGEDLIRTALLSSFSRNRQGNISATWPLIGSQRRPVEILGNSPSNVPWDILHSFYMDLWHVGIEALGTLPATQRIRHASLGDYFPSRHDNHRTDAYTQAILAFKNTPTQDGANQLVASRATHVNELVTTFRSQFPDTEPVIIPIPTSSPTNGVFRTTYLANALQTHLGGNLVSDNLRESRNTPSQMGLGDFDKMGNAATSLSLRTPGNLSGRVVVLIDDVSTSNSTLESARRLAIQAGASHVITVSMGQTVRE